jgi:uncharacterized protein YuzE
MKEPYLEVTYRKGKVLAAYFYLPRSATAKSVKTRRAEPGLIIDLAANGEPLGIEITAPGQLKLETLNQLFKSLGVPRLIVPISPHSGPPRRRRMPA